MIRRNGGGPEKGRHCSCDFPSGAVKGGIFIPAFLEVLTRRIIMNEKRKSRTIDAATREGWEIVNYYASK